MAPIQFSSILEETLPFKLNLQQSELTEMLSQFVYEEHAQKESCFILKGYAGTGKSSLIGAMVRNAEKLKLKFVLLAPTGRAAKVLSGYSGTTAYTIHKKIYFGGNTNDGDFFSLQPNKHVKTIFIVDEASMISGSQGSGNVYSKRNLLDDLFDYVNSGNKCKLLIIGDTAQLPPVGSIISPALDKQYISSRYFINCYTYELTEVVRQQEESGILYNATILRSHIAEQTIPREFIDAKFEDLHLLGGEELEDHLQTAYGKSGDNNTIVICKSNKRANLYNQHIRARIKFMEEEVSAGDLMMVVKNNYHWLAPEANAGFIANGDIIEILKVIKKEELYGFRFANVLYRMPDYNPEIELEAMILLDTINIETPSLSYEDSMRLYNSIMEDYQHVSNITKRKMEVRKDPYLNALQVKFAYAVTCHKAQGGQWENVFLDHGYLTDEMMDQGFIRWLYTGITRATQQLYLINFNEKILQ